MADLSKAIELSPNEPEFYYQRAETYSACGQRDRALKDYDRVLTLKQDFLPAYIPRALYARAVAESRKDERTDSASDVEAARQIAPDVAEIFARHGIVP